MAIKPDTFLLIILTSGITIIIVGMIIAVNCSCNRISCSALCQKLIRLFRKIFRRKARNRDRLSSRGIILYPETYSHSKTYGMALVEGRPQGHGFYSAGPNLSSDPSVSSLSGNTDVLQKITLMTSLGLVGSEYFSAIVGPTGGVTDSTLTPLSLHACEPLPIYSSLTRAHSCGLLNPGFQGDNSEAVGIGGDQLKAVVCANCNGVGITSLNPTDSAVLHLEPSENSSENQNTFDSSASSSADSALFSSTEMDADADIIIMM